MLRLWLLRGVCHRRVLSNTNCMQRTFSPLVTRPGVSAIEAFANWERTTQTGPSVLFLQLVLHRTQQRDTYLSSQSLSLLQLLHLTLLCITLLLQLAILLVTVSHAYC